MIHRKDVRTAGPVESITYCDDRCIVQIAERAGAVHQFHGVPYSVFYGFPSGPNASLAIRRALQGKYLYTLATRADLFETSADHALQTITEAVAQAKQRQEKAWTEAVKAEQEPAAEMNPSRSSFASPVAKPGSGKKRLALSAVVPSPPESS
jgi:hypothetical protein